jgi:hypothetical protein
MRLRFIFLYIFISFPIFSLDNNSYLLLLESSNFSFLNDKLDENKLLETDLKDLRIIRNAIYARYGYKFNSFDLQQYFSKFRWYSAISDNSIVNNKLTLNDKYNIDLILLIEKCKSITIKQEKYYFIPSLPFDFDSPTSFIEGFWPDEYTLLRNGSYTLNHEMNRTKEIGRWSIADGIITFNSDHLEIKVGIGKETSGMFGGEYESYKTENKPYKKSYIYNLSAFLYTIEKYKQWIAENETKATEGDDLYWQIFGLKRFIPAIAPYDLLRNEEHQFPDD